MSDNKKDLTRIEDLGEFLHQLEDDTENYLDLPAIPEDAESPPDELPEVPSEDPPAFDEAPAFGETEESPAFGESVDFGEASTDFGSDSFSTESNDEPFALSEETEATDFGSSDEPAFEVSEPEAEEEPSFSQDSDVTDSDPLSAISASINEAVNEAQDMVQEEATTSFSSDDYAQPDTNFAPEEVESASIESKPDDLAQQYTPKEDFTETKSFAEKAILDDAPAECNPAYSVIARNIRFLEDSEEILSLLKEVGFPEDMMDQYKRQIERGTLLIPRVSEFTAIYVCHRLRRFRLELTMGLSDLIHSPKKSQESDKGLVSRRSLGQNQHHNFEFKADTNEARHIILSTLPQLDGHTIERYMGVASEHSFLESEVVENETAEAIHKSYDELAQKLKGHALSHKANAVVGINYQLTPMPTDGALGLYRYKLTCTGNLVWVHKLSV